MAQAKKQPGTPLTQDELIQCAALLGHSNIGCPLPETKPFGPPNPRHPLTIENAVAQVSQGYMESDHHMRVFEEEAKSWMRELKKDTREEITRIYPDVAALVFN